MTILHKVYSNTLVKYMLFALFLTIFANIITSFALQGLNKSGLDDKYNTDIKYQYGVEKAASLTGKEKGVYKRNNREIGVEKAASLTGKEEGVYRRNYSEMDVNNGRGFITVYPFMGGLGNQMFQLASLIGISTKNNLTMFLCDKYFIPNTVFNFPDILHQRPCDKGLDMFKNYQESSHSKYSDIRLDVSQNWTLEGYFQSFKYFFHCKDLKTIFQFKEEFSQSAERFLKEKVSAGTVTVGIHVRRRDFISLTQQKLGRVAPDKGYLMKAMKIFQRWYKNVTFIVISDDQRWCKDNIQANNVIFSPLQHAGSDLALASQCDHMIITVGTYGWWAGWLSAGQVIYYSGYPRAGSQIDMEFSKEDYYPGKWIPLHG